MQAEQRAKVGRRRLRSRGDPWVPFTVHGPEGSKRRRLRTEKLEERQYAVVEDIDDGRLVLEVSQWPRLDQDGRLVFHGDPFQLSLDLAHVQERVDARRDRGTTTDPRRALRIGDVFLMAGLEEGDTALDGRTRIVDITRAAREAAKAALYSAAASAVGDEYVEEVAIAEESAPRPRRRSGEIEAARRPAKSPGPTPRKQR